MRKFIDMKISEVFDVQKNMGRNVLIPKKEPSNYFIFDQGLRRTAICKSKICHVDMRNGKFFIRGMETILSKDVDFLEFAFHVIFGEGDRADGFLVFKNSVQKFFRIFPEIKSLASAVPVGIHPMDNLSIGILGVSVLAKKYLGESPLREELAGFIIAQVSIIAGIQFRILLEGTVDVAIIDHDNTVFTEKIIRLLHPQKDAKQIVQLSKILNTILILHCEHGMNCSAVSVRNIASSGSDIFSSISAGIAAFKGTLHGGASQQVSEMYDEIISLGISAKEYVEKKIENSVTIMGFGQRTYNQIKGFWDPRVLTMKNMLESNEYDYSSVELYRVLCNDLVQISLVNEFFIKRNLTPNPDLFNCIFYKIFEVPNSMNPVMISLGRVAGWIANYFEHRDKKYPLTRPCDFVDE